MLKLQNKSIQALQSLTGGHSLTHQKGNSCLAAFEDSVKILIEISMSGVAVCYKLLTLLKLTLLVFEADGKLRNAKKFANFKRNIPQEL